MRITPSAVFLIVVNLFPLVGVLAFDWRVFDVLLLYWIENVIIGVINVMRMLLVAPDDAAPRGRPSRSVTPARRLLMSAFFTAHYGMFCFGHLMAVVTLFAGDQGLEAARATLLVESPAELLRSPLALATFGIAMSHLFSFIVNFLLGGERHRTDLGQLMQRPYGRVVVMHVTIIVGGALVQLLGSPVGLLIALVAIKIAVDLALHARERRVFDAADTP